MCEACGPQDEEREQMDLELMAEHRRHSEAEAKRRGLTMEEFLDANVLVSPANHFMAWLANAFLNLQLLRPRL